MPALHPEGKHDPYPRTRTKWEWDDFIKENPCFLSAEGKIECHLLPAGRQNTKEPDNRRLTVFRGKRQEERHSVPHLGPGRHKFPENMVHTGYNSWGLNGIL